MRGKMITLFFSLIAANAFADVTLYDINTSQPVTQFYSSMPPIIQEMTGPFYFSGFSKNTLDFHYELVGVSGDGKSYWQFQISNPNLYGLNYTCELYVQINGVNQPLPVFSTTLSSSNNYSTNVEFDVNNYLQAGFTQTPTVKVALVQFLNGTGPNTQNNLTGALNVNII